MDHPGVVKTENLINFNVIGELALSEHIDQELKLFWVGDLHCVLANYIIL